jgi:cytochrome P450
VAKDHVLRAKREKLEQDRKSTPMDNNTSLFRYIFDSDMPESERSDDRLAKEAQVLLGAGTSTTARTLSFISFYILANPDIHSRLKEELRDVMATYPQHVPSWAQLERLPYLQALIKEGLR